MNDNVFAPPRSDVEVQEGPDALWELDWKGIRKLYLASVNVRALGMLYGLAAFGTLVSGGVGILMPAQPQLKYMPALMAIFIAIGLLYLVACVTSYTRPSWGRWLGIGVATLSLFSFPIGTIIGILALIAYIQGARLFGPDRFLHKDVVLAYKQRKKEKK